MFSHPGSPLQYIQSFIIFERTASRNVLVFISFYRVRAVHRIQSVPRVQSLDPAGCTVTMYSYLQAVIPRFKKSAPGEAGCSHQAPGTVAILMLVFGGVTGKGVESRVNFMVQGFRCWGTGLGFRVWG